MLWKRDIYIKIKHSCVITLAQYTVIHFLHISSKAFARTVTVTLISGIYIYRFVTDSTVHLVSSVDTSSNHKPNINWTELPNYHETGVLPDYEVLKSVVKGNRTGPFTRLSIINWIISPSWQLPFRICGTEIMTVETIPWSNSTKEWCRTEGSNPRPPNAHRMPIRPSYRPGSYQIAGNPVPRHINLISTEYWFSA